MKIQCSCGLKYSFDVTPEMAQSPITFVCKSCGADNSALTNQLIRQELGLPASASTSPPLASGVPALAPPPTTEHVTVRMKGAGSTIAVRMTSASAPSASAAPPLASPPKAAGALRVSVHKPPAAVTEAAPKVEAPQMCPKHPGQLATQRCAVCGKAICPKCMEIFGFVCSALCKGKAEAQGKHVPVYAGQKSAAESRLWRKLGLLTLIGCVLAIAAGGSWFWYTYSGSIPKRFLLVRFPDPGGAGQMRFVAQNQLVILHGLTLSRHDIKLKKEIWSNVLVDKKKIADDATAQFEKSKDAPFDPNSPRLTLPELIENNETVVARDLHLYVQGENLWVAFKDKLVRYDWESGKPAKEIPFEGAPLRVAAQGNELLLVADNPSRPKITHVELASGNSRTEELGAAPSAKPKAPALAAPANSGRAPIASRLAAPAVRAAKANQQRALAEIKKSSEPEAAVSTPAALAGTPLLPAGTGFLQLSFKPIGSSTTGTAGQRFQVAVRRLDGAKSSDWTGETVGETQLFPLKTVDVLVGGRAFWVFDKNLKVLWEGQLNHDPVGQHRNLLANQIPAWGEGPLVERGDTLYIFDKGELSAFELAGGKLRWRFPIEFVVGMFFDDKGMIYLNSCYQHESLLTTIDYSILPEEKLDFIQKIDGNTGSPLWKASGEGSIRYVSGKFIYTVAAQQGDPGEDEDIDSMPVINTGFQKIPHVRIKRLDPGNGRVLWEHYHRHTPLDVQFDKNTISVLCKKEMRALKFFAF